LDRTTTTVAAAEQIVRSHAEIRGVSWLVGGSFPSVFYNLVMRRDDAPYYAQGIIYTDTFQQVKRLIPVLQGELDAALPGAQIVVRQFAQGPPVEADIEIELSGQSIPILQALGERVRGVLARQPEVLHTRASMERGTPKLWIDVNEDEARLAGLRLADISAQLEGQLEGRTGGSVVEGLEEVPVRIRFEEGHRRDLAAVASSSLVSPTSPNDWVPLPTLAEVRLRPEIAEVSHCESVRCNTIRGYVRNDALAIDVVGRVLADLERDGLELPAGYTLSLGGESEEQADAIGKLGLYLPVLAVLMVATLVLSFGSLKLAALLAGVAGLSVGLALLSTWLSGFPVSFNSILGTLGLMGVALNDSIVVLAALRANPKARRGEIDAVVDEVMASSGHVLATTLTTIGGFLPLLIFIGGDFWPPLAIVLAGGVLGATLIALLLVPAAYLLLGDTQAAIATEPAAPLVSSISEAA
jgi:multidrug efflux pump subunit AcrB